MLDYRLFIEVHGDRRRVEKLASEQLYSWLRSKRLDADALEPGRAVALADRVEGLMLEMSRKDGSRALRARITEDKSDGRWITTLTVDVPAIDRRRPWLWLDVEAPGSRRARAPRLARNLLDVFDGRDGGARLGPGPIRVSGADVGALVDSVCDPRRRGLIFVAGSAQDHDISTDLWSAYVARLVEDTVGLSGAYVLDPAATDVFNNAIGPIHAMAPWTVRTFRPGVEPDDPVNGMKHRVLGLGRIAKDSDRKIAVMLGRRAREAALEVPLPRAAVIVDRDFERQIDDRLTQRLTRQMLPRPRRVEDEYVSKADSSSLERETLLSPETDRTRQEPSLGPALIIVLDSLRQLTDRDEITLAEARQFARFAHIGHRAEASQEAITERLQGYEKQVAELTEASQELRLQLEDSQLEQLIVEDEHGRTAAQVRHLQKLLSASGRAADAWASPEVDEGASRPDDYEGLLEKINGLSRVAFTGAEASVRELDRHDKAGIWAGRIWDAFCALEDYALVTIEGRCERDVHGYLEHTPDGCHAFSANRHARDESEDVRNNPRYRQARMFAVPSLVSDDQCIFMGAHFKIATFGLVSPRMHYYDDVRRSEKIYVGYIGKHLPTKRTN